MIIAVVISIIATSVSLYGLWCSYKGHKALVDHYERIKREDAWFRQQIIEALEAVEEKP